MESLNRIFSGEVPGGFFLYFTVILVLLFFRWFMVRFSPVVNKRKFSIFIYVVTGFIAVSFTVMRLARPPKPNTVYIGILPLDCANAASDTAGQALVSRYAGTGWSIAETATRYAESASPSHLNFLRPEWLVSSHDNDSLGRVSFFDQAQWLDWATLIKLKYAVSGTFTVHPGSIDIHVVIFETSLRKQVKSRDFSIPTGDGNVWLQKVQEIGLELTKDLYALAEEELDDTKLDLNYAKTPALLDYARGRYLLSQKLIDSSLFSFQEALRKDSLSSLTWYGLGLAHGEIMIRSKDKKKQQFHQIRTEYHLKKAGQLNETFQPSVSALAKYYMFFKPEPRYLDAEIALIGANGLYDRDYTVYYILSYMQKLRWESFGMSTKEDVLKKAIAVNPAGFDSYINLGRAFLELSRPHDYRAKLAMEYYQIAHKLRPVDFEAIIGMVTACDYVGFYDRALKLLEFAEKIYPTKADVYYNMGVVNYHIGNTFKPKKMPKEEREQYSKAEAYFRKAIQFKPNHGYAYLYLAKISAEFKNDPQAIESLRMVMKLLDREDPYREEARKKLNEYFPDVEG